MSAESYYLEDLSSIKLKSLLEQIGGTVSLKSGDATRLTGRAVGKVVGDSIRSRIAAKLLELQAKYPGDLLTAKNQLVPGLAREEYEEWYLVQRADDIGVKHDEAHYRKWSHVHLADTLKFRRETLA